LLRKADIKDLNACLSLFEQSVKHFVLRIIQKIKFVLGLKLIDNNGKKNLNMMRSLSMKKEEKSQVL